MRTVLIALVLLAAVAAFAPVADAEQACTHDPRSQHCHSHLACVYNRVTGEWDCFVEIACPYDCQRPDA